MKLEFVNKKQALKLKKIGFDLEIDYAYHDGSGIIVPIVGSLLNWNAYEKSQSAPTVALALKWIRDTFGISQTIFVRSLDTMKFGYTVSHAILPLDLTHCDLSNEYEIEDAGTDGIHGMTYEESESIGLDFALDWLIKKSSEGYGSSPKECIENYCIETRKKALSYYPKSK